MVAVVHGGWWKALNAILGMLLIVGGIMSFIHPENTFVAIASIIGFMFLFVGILDLIIAFSDRTGLWWIRLITGVLCIGLAFWASGDFNRKAILLGLGGAVLPVPRDQQLHRRLHGAQPREGGRRVARGG